MRYSHQKFKHVSYPLQASVTFALAQFILFPLDTIKHRIQAHRTLTYSTAIQKTPMKGSIIALTIHFSSPIIKTSAYNILHPSLSTWTDSQSATLTGGCAGVIKTLTLYPLDLFKVKKQTHDRQLATLFDNVIKKDGLKGLYKGLTPTLLRSCTSTGTWYGAHRQLENNIPSSIPFKSFISGSLASVGAALLTYPLDLLKTRAQAHNINWITTAKKEFRSRGIKGMYRGFLGSSVYMLAYGGMFGSINQYYLTHSPSLKKAATSRVENPYDGRDTT